MKGSYIPHDGGVYCRADYLKLLGYLCAVCGESINGDYVEISSRRYHLACKTCRVSDAHLRFRYASPEIFVFVNGIFLSRNVTLP